MAIADQIKELVQSQPGLTEREVVEAMFGDGASKGRVNEACRKLVDEGGLERRGTGGQSDPFRYHTAEATATNPSPEAEVPREEDVLSQTAEGVAAEPAMDAPRSAADEKRHAILQEMLTEAAFDGWTAEALRAAAISAGLTDAEISRGDLSIYFPKGPADVLAFWSEEEDRALSAAWANLADRPQRIRDKVTWLVKSRVEQLADHKEASRRAAATLSLPQNAALGMRLTWATADTIWRALGDSSTDFNYYTKRTTLSGVYASTLQRWFSDEGDVMAAEPYEATWAFLDKRIDNVMQIEKIKAKAAKFPVKPEAVASFLGSLRHRAKRGAK